MNDTDSFLFTLAGLGVAGVLAFVLAEVVSRRMVRAQALRAVWLAATALLITASLAELLGVRARLEPLWETAPPKVTAAVQAQTPTPKPLPTVTAPPILLTAQPLAETPANTDQIFGWLAVAWIGGAVLLLGRCGLAMALLPLVRRRFQPVQDAALLSLAREVREHLGMKRTPELRQGTVASPMTFGVLRPVVCLPPDFVEFAHIAGLDTVWRCLSEVMTALLWWHPAAWLTRRRLHSACEFAADEASRLAGPVSGSLAEALVALAAKPGPVAPWPILAAAGDGYHSDLGQRVERLLEPADAPASLPASGWKQAVLAVMVASIALLGLSACRTGGSSPMN
jgi:beta-lactamase regulating signal transducer with metallopeptidase domain